MSEIIAKSFIGSQLPIENGQYFRFYFKYFSIFSKSMETKKLQQKIIKENKTFKCKKLFIVCITSKLWQLVKLDLNFVKPYNVT